MNCRNCGAPMELFERRRYFFCIHCGSFSFINTPEVEGIRLLERPVPAPDCRRCRAPLIKALLDDGYAVEHCERCRGILLPRAAFAEAVTRRRASQSGAPAPPVPMDPRELKHVVVCPSCRSQMDVHPYYGQANVVIDSCEQCDLIWLDFGELTQITEAGGRDRAGTSQFVSACSCSLTTPSRWRRPAAGDSTPDHGPCYASALVPWKRDALPKSRSAAPGWQGAKSELIGHK
jgi:Zn-finger nucleic acid-binding protein